MMYGLQRRSVLEKIERIPGVLFSDHIFLSRVSLHGQFLQEPGTRWYRGERRTGGSKERQRSALFSGRPPLMTFAPIWIQHSRWLLSTLVFRRRGRPDISRVQAVGLTFAYVANWWNRVYKANRFQRTRTKARKRQVWGGAPRVPLRAAVGLELSRRIRVAETTGKYPPEVHNELALISRRLRMSRWNTKA
jgi:hypothetical protein